VKFADLLEGERRLEVRLEGIAPTHVQILDPPLTLVLPLVQVGGRVIHFLLDCGATVNLMPETLIRDLGRLHEVRPAESTLYTYVRQNRTVYER